MSWQVTHRNSLIALVLVVAGLCDLFMGPPPHACSEFVANVAEVNSAPAPTKTIRGVVRWHGDVPSVPSLKLPKTSPTGFVEQSIPNPYSPKIMPNSRTLAGAVVRLRSANIASETKTEFPRTTVEHNDDGITLSNGNAVALVGVGSQVELVSRNSRIDGIRARGDDFFTVMFPGPNQSKMRTFRKPGRVMISSASGLYWAAATLVVCEHRFYAITTQDGAFTFQNVPVGEYELDVWLPNWQTASQERDPETGVTFRQTYAPGGELTRRIVVTDGELPTFEISFDSKLMNGTPKK